MADMERIVVVWSGLAGLPGVSVFFGTVGASANAGVKAFFTSVASVIPTGCSWDIPGSGDLIDDATGTLTGVWTNAGGGGTVAASGSTSHASGCGAYVNWNTAGIANGRRVKGRTFLCPLSANQYEANGTIAAAGITTMQTAATALVTTGDTLIWHRPGTGTGSSFSPSSATVPDQVTSLRTRRR